MNLYYTTNIANFVESIKSDCLETSFNIDYRAAVPLTFDIEYIRPWVGPYGFVRIHIKRKLLGKNYEIFYQKNGRNYDYNSVYVLTDIQNILEYISSVEIYYARNSEDLGENDIDSLISLNFDIIPQLRGMGIDVVQHEAPAKGARTA